MGKSRIALAADRFAALPEAGRIGIYNSKAETDLSALPGDRLVLFQALRPEHDALAARGLAVAPEPEGALAAAVILVPRSRAQARGWIADACERLPAGAPLWIDGARTDGIEPLLREVAVLAGPGETIAKAHGRIAAFRSPGPIPDWIARPSEVTPGFVTLPGVFSADGPDPGSVALAAALPARLSGRIVDLGAGWGWLGAQVLERPGVASLVMVEADHVAVRCARQNVGDPRSQVVWADATRPLPGIAADVVVMNPPFHAGRAGDPSLGAAFIAAAAGMLVPSGELWMVANRHLPYEAVLHRHFREVTEAPGTPSFKVLHARRPAAGGGSPSRPDRLG